MKYFAVEDTENQIYKDTKIPMIGLGTYKIRGVESCLKVIDNALEIGYRLFDTAQVYKNEADLGQSFESLLPKYNLKREDIFITTKIAPYNHGEKCEESLRKSLQDLRTTYVDLVLIHWPGVKGLKLDDERNSDLRRSTYQTLEKLHSEGLIKLIGVSNYNIKHLTDLLSYARIKPQLLQSEFHPLLQQKELLSFCRANSIIFQAYSSLGTSDKELAQKLTRNDVICSIAQKYSKSPAQILLKWTLEQDIGIIPKSENKEHLKENFDLFDFLMEKSSIDMISNLNENLHLCWNPDTVS